MTHLVAHTSYTSKIGIPITDYIMRYSTAAIICISTGALPGRDATPIAARLTTPASPNS